MTCLTCGDERIVEEVDWIAPDGMITTVTYPCPDCGPRDEFHTPQAGTSFPTLSDPADFGPNIFSTPPEPASTKTTPGPARLSTGHRAGPGASSRPGVTRTQDHSARNPRPVRQAGARDTNGPELHTTEIAPAPLTRPGA